jgi:hypothetical protein
VHTARQLDASTFRVKRKGRSATRDDLLPNWSPFDGLGVVVTEPFGALGASHLIQLAITAFYDIRPSRRNGRSDVVDPDAIYPEILLFHVGAAYGDHSAFDVWPARKEVFVDPDPRCVLDAINDRAISRLVVPDSDPAEVVHEHKEPAAARDRIATALVYSPAGRVRDPEWEIVGLDSRTEINPGRVLDPEKRYVSAALLRQVPADALLRERSWPVQTAARRDEARDGLGMAQDRRAAMRNDSGLAAETYRSVDVDEALAMLV